jgi:RND family efflux transporter MFP subunit
VEAPFDGVITARNVDVGSLVTGTGSAASADNTAPTSGLFGIARSDRLRAVAEVPEAAAFRVKVGMDARVEVTDVPEEKFQGKVWMRSGGLDQSSRTLRVEVLLENRGLKAMPGMYCRLRMDVPGEAWRLPSTALQVDSSGTHIVLVDANNVCHRLAVKVSRDLGKELELVYPFKGDERVVTDPGALLTDGTKVELAKATPKP